MDACACFERHPLVFLIHPIDPILSQDNGQAIDGPYSTKSPKASQAMRFFRGLVFVLTICGGLCLHAQEKSVKPGINDSFKDPNPDRKSVV